MADYTNPFEEHSSAPPPLPPLPPHPIPEVPPRPYESHPTLTAEQLLERERNLQIKEQELAEWERRLAERERGGEVKRPRPPNWPPCKPFLHHNIEGDMPTPETKSVVRKAYVGWLAFLVALTWNLVAVTSVLAVGGSGRAADFVLGLVYFFLLPPLTFLIYRILYHGARKGSAGRYLVYLCFLILEILVFIVFGIGIPRSGGGGFIQAIDVMEAKPVVGILLLVSGAVWFVLAIYHIVLWFFVRRAYSHGTGGLKQAKREATAAALA